MSFQDVGKRNSQRPPVNAAMTTGSSSSSSSSSPHRGPTTAPRSGGFHTGSLTGLQSTASATAQISDSITQYQRNVGILEKIAHALVANTGGSGGRTKREELEQQYKAQSDVLRELEARLKEQILAQRQRCANSNPTQSSSSSASSAQKQALLKLERDFERVQAITVATKAKVVRHRKQAQQREAAVRHDADAAARGASADPHNHARTVLQQQQVQLQQDRLQEEIMREREEEIRQINRGMHQVNEIYKDLAHIVGEQQDDIDGIETKMEETKASAQSGLEQVEKANDKYGGGPGANCCLS